MLQEITLYVKIVVPFISIIALYFSWRKIRDDHLRKDEVLRWSNEVIECLQSLYIICSLSNPPWDSKFEENEISKIMFKTSVLTEQGRMFFRNKIANAHGADKQPAYKGYRPLILDHIVLAHQIACAWGTAENATRLRMGVLAEDCVKKFVSLAQNEVGRDRTASANTGKSGDGMHLHMLLDSVDENRFQSQKNRVYL